MGNNLTILLIDSDYIKERSTIMSNVEDAFITPHVFAAQDIYIQQILGSNLYDAMMTDFVQSAQTFASSKYVTLNESYIQPCLLYYTLYECIDDLYAKYTNKSIVVQNSENSTVISEEYLSKRKDDYLNKAEYYSQRITNYLLDNQTTYTEYLTSDGDISDIHPETNAYTHGGWYLKNTGNKWCENSPYTRFHNL